MVYLFLAEFQLNEGSLDAGLALYLWSNRHSEVVDRLAAEGKLNDFVISVARSSKFNIGKIFVVLVE